MCSSTNCLLLLYCLASIFRCGQADNSVPTNSTHQLLRVGIIGAGANTRRHHIPKLQQLPMVQVVAVANRSPASTASVADQFGIPKRASCWKEIIEDAEIDAIVIGTWPYMHKAMTLAALGAGKHVLTEARMAMDVAEAKEMLAASQLAPHLVTQIVPSPLTLRWDRTIQRLLSDHAIGQLLHVDVRGVSGRSAAFNSSMHWRQSLELSGANTMSLGILYEAMRRWVGDATRVSAISSTVVTRRRTSVSSNAHSDGDLTGLKAVQIPDHLEVIGRLAYDHAQFHMLISDVIAGGDGQPNTEFWLYGTIADLHLDIDAGKLMLHHTDELTGHRIGTEIVPGESELMRWRVEEEFVSAIRGHEKISYTPFEVGLRYMEFTTAVRRSAQEDGLPISLPFF